MFRLINLYQSKLFLFILDLCQSNILPLAVVPKSAVVRIHANASFECKVNNADFPFWEFLDIAYAKETFIVLKNGVVERFKSRYRINNNSGGPHVLVINHVDHGHAGRYTCMDHDLETKASAELTVIGN